MSEVLHGNIVRLEPLEIRHAEGLASASMIDNGLYNWSPVPKGIEEAQQYIRTALEWKQAGTAQPYAIVSVHGNTVIGSTRFFLIEKWAWKPEHPRHGRAYPDAAEIGYTWLDNSAIRTGANTEAKYLLLQLAFEKWQSFRICLHTDVRNERSKAAIERIGGRFEGVLRAHRLANDATPRDSARFSILLSEWPEVKQRLHQLLKRK
jgi:RimJ/RimL family protein N-acetyltransferase